MASSLSPLLLLGVVLSIAGLASASPPRSAHNVGEGRSIYEKHCADCHGPEGRGDGKMAVSLSPRPGNLISAQTSAKSDQDLLNIIANGKRRTAMPAWKDRLSEREQLAVLAYIRSMIHFSGSATPPPPSP